MAFDLDDAEDLIERLVREIDELRQNLGKVTRHLSEIEPRVSRMYNFLWQRMSEEE